MRRGATPGAMPLEKIGRPFRALGWGAVGPGALPRATLGCAVGAGRRAGTEGVGWERGLTRRREDAKGEGEAGLDKDPCSEGGPRALGAPREL